MEMHVKCISGAYYLEMPEQLVSQNPFFKYPLDWLKNHQEERRSLDLWHLKIKAIGLGFNSRG